MNSTAQCHLLREISVCTYDKTKLKATCRGRTGFSASSQQQKQQRPGYSNLKQRLSPLIEFILTETSRTVDWKHRKKLHLLASVTSIFSGLIPTTTPLQKDRGDHTSSVLWNTHHWALDQNWQQPPDSTGKCILLLTDLEITNEIQVLKESP